MLRQYRLCLFLIGFSMAAMDAVAVEFKRLDLKAPYELFYENAVINGQIGQSLVVTNNSGDVEICLLYTSPSPRDATLSRMPSSA